MERQDNDQRHKLRLVWHVGGGVGRRQATQYMRRLAAQQPIWHRSYGLIAQLLGAGSRIGWAYSFRIERMKKDGAPVDWVNSFDPILENVTGIGISAKPNNPHAARLSIDFVLSKKGQEMIAICCCARTKRCQTVGAEDGPCQAQA